MPRVPTYQPQAQVRNLPGTRLDRVDVSSGLQGLAGGIDQAGRAADTMRQEEQRKADAAALLEADRRLSAWEIETLHKPQTGALNRQGKDALGVIDEFRPGFDSTLAEIEAGLTAEQRARFRQLAEGRRRSMELSLHQHVARQSDAILQSELKAYEQTAIAAIAVNAGDAERVREEIERLQIAQEVAMDRMGVPAEVRRATAQATLQTAHSAVLDQLLARGDYTGARRYFESHRDLLGAKSAQYQEQVRRGDVIQQSQDIADRIMAAVGTGRAATDEARRIEDPDVRDAVMRRLDQEHQREERDRREFERQVSESAWTKINAGQGIESLTPREWAVAAQSSGALAAMENRARQIARGEPPETDLGLWYGLLNASADPSTQQDFANLDLMQFSDRLSKTDFQNMAALQTRLKNGEDPVEIRDFRTRKQVVDHILAEHEITNNRVIAQFHRALGDEEMRFRQQHNRAPNYQELESMADQLLIRGSQPGWLPNWLFGSNTARAFAADPARPFTPREVPRGEVGRITRGLIAAGVPRPTSRQILDAWIMEQQQETNDAE